MKRLMLLSALLGLGLVGCKGPCRQLSEKLCDCTLNSVDKTGCLQRASAAESSNPPTEEDDAKCRELLRDELGVSPSPQTEAVYLEILRAE